MDEDNVIVVKSDTIEYLDIVGDIIGSEMGFLHSYYAVESVKNGWARTVVAFLDDTPIGVGIYYNIGPEICVHYYIVVTKSYRGLGVGKILVSSIEELNKNSTIFLATTREDNHASRRLFRSLGYIEYTWDYLEEKAGFKTVREIMRATCSFDDDLVMVKASSDDSLSLLARYVWKRRETVLKVWRDICWKPWIRLRMH